MKTILNFILTLWISLSFSFSVSGQETLITNLTVPGSFISQNLTDGINPEDILFADDKYFICGLGTVLVMNTNYEYVNTLTFSDRGQHVSDHLQVQKGGIKCAAFCPTLNKVLVSRVFEALLHSASDLQKKIEIQIDPNHYSILCPNGSHSNISIISCPERIPIPERYNWVSFPRLNDNFSYDSDDALNNKLFPQLFIGSEGRMDIEDIVSIPEPQKIPLNIKKYINHTEWEELPQGNLEYVTSFKGYVLDTYFDSPNRVLDLYGDVLTPESIFPFTLYSHYDNWIGYFLPGAQSPFDAIATEFLDEITWIAGQNWFCHKETNPGTKSSSYSWRCACEQERLEIKYGDMIKIYPSENITGFHWQSVGQPSLDEPKLAADYYQYQEQAAYEPFLIELDTTDQPLELAAFAGDSCVGATKVDANDSLVLVRGFTNGYEGETITFEMYYGPVKLSSGKIRDYIVSTATEPVRKRRSIIAGESAEWYDISFKNTGKSLSETDRSWIQCSPNPFSGTCTIQFSVSENGYIKLEVLDILGRCVATLDDGYKENGTYRVVYPFAEAGLGMGVYFLRLTTDRLMLTNKIIHVY